MKVFFVFVILSAFFSMIYAKTVKERLMDFRHVSDTEPSPVRLLIVMLPNDGIQNFLTPLLSLHHLLLSTLF
jgi:hypothetical protein